MRRAAWLSTTSSSSCGRRALELPETVIQESLRQSSTPVTMRNHVRSSLVHGMGPTPAQEEEEAAAAVLLVVVAAALSRIPTHTHTYRPYRHSVKLNMRLHNMQYAQFTNNIMYVQLYNIFVQL